MAALSRHLLRLRARWVCSPSLPTVYCNLEELCLPLSSRSPMPCVWSRSLVLTAFPLILLHGAHVSGFSLGLNAKETRQWGLAPSL